MYFRQILHEEKFCLSYIIGCKSAGECVVIDPQGSQDVYINEARRGGMEISAIIETHLQTDHQSVAHELAVNIGAKHYLGSGAVMGYQHETLQDGQTLRAGNREFTIIHTPGHTPEHICLLVDNWFMLTGDTLFVGDVGRVDLVPNVSPQGIIPERAKMLYQSLQRLLQLPDWIEIYPGHYAGSMCGRGIDGKPISTIGRERRQNPMLQLPEDAFIAFQQKNIPQKPADFCTIQARKIIDAT